MQHRPALRVETSSIFGHTSNPHGFWIADDEIVMFLPTRAKICNYLHRQPETPFLRKMLQKTYLVTTAFAKPGNCPRFR